MKPSVLTLIDRKRAKRLVKFCCQLPFNLFVYFFWLNYRSVILTILVRPTRSIARNQAKTASGRRNAKVSQDTSHWQWLSVITTMVIRPLDDHTHTLCSISLLLFGDLERRVSAIGLFDSPPMDLCWLPIDKYDLPLTIFSYKKSENILTL